MSSQHKYVNAYTVQIFCLTLQWVFMISTIITFIEWTDTLKLIDFIPFVAFLHYTMRFHTLNHVYNNDCIANYNQEVERVNRLPRRLRRIYIRYMFENLKK
jgi:hypothetical protein